jgi:hypothetical protein
MCPHYSAGSARRLLWLSMSLVLGLSSLAHAAGDCAPIDVKSAASILGVSTARANPTNPARSKVPPDNTDLVSCGYAEATVDPSARTLSYSIYSPTPSDLASVYGSVATGNFPRQQLFSPNVGKQSNGWFRSSVRDDTFEGYVAMQTGAIVVVIKIGGMPSSESVKNALVAAAKVFATS